MGFIVPDGCSIRAGTEWRQWQVGKCIVFDDSFEHEVRPLCGSLQLGSPPTPRERTVLSIFLPWHAQVKHEGEGVRVVLLMNFWHPELPRERWGPVVPQSQYGVA
jgi:aspartate beta-hydroxylase